MMSNIDDTIKQLLAAAFLSKAEIATRLGVELSEVERVETVSEFTKPDNEYEG